eukprot:7376644-Lingulodinium_polyedra.AAC.1
MDMPPLEHRRTPRSWRRRPRAHRSRLPDCQRAQARGPAAGAGGRMKRNRPEATRAGAGGARLWKSRTPAPERQNRAQRPRATGPKDVPELARWGRTPGKGTRA